METFGYHSNQISGSIKPNFEDNREYILSIRVIPKFDEAPTKNTGLTLFTNISHYKSLRTFGCYGNQSCMKMMCSR